jgi:hypothetical protein
VNRVTLGSPDLGQLDETSKKESRDFAHGVLDMLIDDMNRPAFRAGFTAAVLTAGVMARLGARALPSVVISAMMGAAVEHLYGLGEDAVDCLRDLRTRAAREV